MNSQATGHQKITERKLTDLGVRLGNVLRLLRAQVATAESCTGGGIAEAITRAPGSSAWFEAGFVTYSDAQKIRQLGVPGTLLSQVGAVSREVVEAMAKGAQAHSNARYAIAVSGVAGPSGGTPHKPVGTVWFAWADGERVYSQCQHFSGDRQEVRQQSVVFALEQLIGISIGKIPKQG